MCCWKRLFAITSAFSWQNSLTFFIPYSKTKFACYSRCFFQDWKRSVFIQIPKKGNAKECSNYCTIALISHASKVMLKILQARLQQHVNRELPDVQAGFRKGRGTRDQSANTHWIIKKAREFQKNIYFCFCLHMCAVMSNFLQPHGLQPTTF